QKNISSSESTLKCAYGAGTSRGCHPAMTGTKEQREKPLCGTLPDWNVWCIGGAVWVSRAMPGWLLVSKTNGYKGTFHPDKLNVWWTNGIRMILLPLVFLYVGSSLAADMT